MERVYLLPRDFRSLFRQMSRFIRSWVYTASPHVIGSHDGYIPPPLLRLVLTMGIYRLPFCDWFSRW
eukprot:3960490-Pyramimonas_sp.AAC.1